MTSFKEMTDDQLIKEYKGLHGAIYDVECYSCSDMRRLAMVGDELVSRGYRISEGYKAPAIDKEDDDE